MGSMGAVPARAPELGGFVPVVSAGASSAGAPRLRCRAQGCGAEPFRTPRWPAHSCSEQERPEVRWVEGNSQRDLAEHLSQGGS